MARICSCFKELLGNDDVTTLFGVKVHLLQLFFLFFVLCFYKVSVQRLVSETLVIQRQCINFPLFTMAPDISDLWEAAMGFCVS